MPPSKPDSERARLLELYSMGVLAPEQDAVLDTFCEKVAKLFNVPTCMVSLVLEDRQWFKSSFGCPADLARARETPRDISFCTHVVASGKPLIVRNISKDKRFAKNPLVQEYGFNFYAGFPLRTGRGNVLGTLCLYDIRPRNIVKRELGLLLLFSERVIAHLELGRELAHTRASEAKFRSIAESAHDALIVIGEDERIIEVNPAVERMFGWTREALLGQPVERIMPKRYHQRHHESMAQFIHRGTSDKFGRARQFEAVRRDGTEFPIEISISGFKAGDKWIFTGFIRDITERRKAEEELQEKTERLRLLVEQMPAILWSTDPELRITSVLGAGLAPLNLRADDVVGTPLADHLGTRDPEFLPIAAHLRALRGESVSYEFQFRERIFQCHIEPLRDSSQTVRGTVGVALDITDRKRAEEALGESQRTFSTLMGNLPGMAYRCRHDQDWTLEFASEGCFPLTGYQPADLILNKNASYAQLIHPDDLEPVANEVEAAIREKRPFHLVYRIISAEGEEKWVWEQGTGVFTPEGKLLALEGFIADITERKRAEALLLVQKIVLEMIARGEPLPKVLEGLARVIEEQSKGVVCCILLLDKDGIHLRQGAAPSLPDSYNQAVDGLEIGPSVGSCGTAAYRREPVIVSDIAADPLWASCRDLALGQGLRACWSTPILSTGGKVLGTFAMYYRETRVPTLHEKQLVEVSTHLARIAIERQQAEEALAEQAIRDTLTNLYNRRYFQYRIDEEILRASRNKEYMAILLCDLDHFKAINDARGHQAGDEVLKEVAQGVQDSTRGTDLVFRWGGDEILVVLSDATREGVLIAAERIRKAVRAISEKSQLGLDLSIGVALYPEHGSTIDELIRLADRALYIAKQGGDKVHIGEEEYRLAEDSIKVVFQPVVDVRTNQMLGYEALSRDAQGKLGILALFKRYQAVGQLNELKRLCFRKQLKTAQAIGLKRMFINVDFNVLSQMEVVTRPPDMDVILEISEVEALHDIENHLRITRQWREKGFKFAMDDFGAGFISLPFIAQLIPDYIKLDRSTILQAVSSETFRRFLKDMLLALRNYSTEGIIAEGVETEKELQLVKEMGIYLVQGFLLGKPQELKTIP